MSAPAVELLGAHKRYGSVRAVDGLDLVIPRGETVALLGPNGAGKSSTVGLILGLLDPDEGSVRVTGRTPREAVVQGRIGAMLQDGGLTSGVTVGELLDFARSLHRGAPAREELLREVGLEGLDGRLVTQLSGGQSQRLRLALARVGRPDLLVLDEPTVGMDVEARVTFWRAMHDYAREGRTVLFATHYLREAEEAADRTVVLADGRVAADGATREVRARAGARTVRARLEGASPAALKALPGVRTAHLNGDEATLHTSDADATVKRLLALHPEAHDLEVTRADLEDAFLAIVEGGAPLEAAA